MVQTEVPKAPIRRATRVQIALPVLVCGKGFREKASTVSVSAYGCPLRPHASTSALATKLKS
jgi:hypothetical protein